MAQTKAAEAKRRLIQLLRANPEGLTAAELVRRAGISAPTLTRARQQLMREGAPLEYVAASRRWVLRGPWSSPLEDPQPEDLTALMIGKALLEPLVEAEITARLERIVEDLDQLLREHAGVGPLSNVPRPGSISTTVTMATTVQPQILWPMLGALRRSVVRIDYVSGWSGKQSFYDIEPWGLRLVDGAMYVRAYSRAHSEPRTFNMALVRSCAVTGNKSSAAPPLHEDVWSDGDPAYGIDNHEPGVATVRLRGPVARWASHFRWHSAEVVKQIGDGDLFERSVPYRSRREFARKLLSVIDAVVSIEPQELEDEVTGYIEAFLGRSIKK